MNIDNVLNGGIENIRKLIMNKMLGLMNIRILIMN